MRNWPLLELHIEKLGYEASLAWISDSGASRLSGQSALLSSISSSKFLLPPMVSPLTWMKHCLRTSTHLKLCSRLEQGCAEVIVAVIGLAETLPLSAALGLYNSRLLSHHHNETAFVKRIKPSGHCWTATAYFLAIETVEEDDVDLGGRMEEDCNISFGVYVELGTLFHRLSSKEKADHSRSRYRE